MRLSNPSTLQPFNPSTQIENDRKKLRRLFDHRYYLSTELHDTHALNDDEDRGTEYEENKSRRIFFVVGHAVRRRVILYYSV